MKIFSLACAIAFTLAAPAFAAPPTYRFTIIGDDSYYFYYSFDLPVMPTSTSNHIIATQFSLNNIAINTVADPFQGDVWFFTQAEGGGIEVDTAGDGDDILLSTNGPTLYSGSELHPTFTTGSFTLTDWFDPDGPTPAVIHSYTLTIGNAAAAPPPPPPPSVPEPASWALMLCGFGAIGGVMRARRTSKVSFG
ncbi:MAG TPA: PEPxxWA-CTERM sorting domain-containing protein [Sphingomonas sp.]|uniref:PEPxxWA-CTERM sorting domain-containing protein n=1 Tax=Sphingomonas sp. TaxID=28214 RepID=UPI002CA505F6|nr:PEPxxWA-CTERM sorting domain-containing protein [Sphingomonas sp.]HMI19795.1 PEPxxWA-CTERM sorting domain-containing protein [Sphingomonas sp.]